LSSQNIHQLDEIFHPKSLAVVGASASEPGAGWVARQIQFGFKGTVYPVNPRATEIDGLKCYPTLRDIPGPVDYVIFNVPLRLAPQIMEDCVAKKVKIAHIFTAGFSETGTAEGKQTEARVAAIAKAGGVRVLGPNCMGLHYPAEGITFNSSHSKQPGHLAFISQSGAGANRFIGLANSRGIYFSKAISYGNAIDLNASDLMEYLTSDDETRIIACYTEGVREGQRFFNAVKNCTKTKPVVMLKAGLTEGGAGAAASHTASLAGSVSTWNAFFKQTGTIQVNSLEEIADVVLALSLMTSPKGRRVGIVGRGGGLGVMATDACERAGLKVPPFVPETRQRLLNVIPEVGAGVRNPVETDARFSGIADFYTNGLKIVAADPQIDFILTHIGVDVYGGRVNDLQGEMARTADVLARVAPTLPKPVAIVLYPGEHLKAISAVLETRERLVKAGIPVYPTIDAAARAVNRLIDYHEFLKTINQG